MILVDSRRQIISIPQYLDTYYYLKSIYKSTMKQLGSPRRTSIILPKSKKLQSFFQNQAPHPKSPKPQNLLLYTFCKPEIFNTHRSPPPATTHSSKQNKVPVFRSPKNTVAKCNTNILTENHCTNKNIIKSLCLQELAKGYFRMPSKYGTSKNTNRKSQSQQTTMDASGINPDICDQRPQSLQNSRCSDKEPKITRNGRSQSMSCMTKRQNRREQKKLNVVQIRVPWVLDAFNSMHKQEAEFTFGGASKQGSISRGTLAAHRLTSPKMKGSMAAHKIYGRHRVLSKKQQ